MPGFLPYGEEWRAQRKLTHMVLSPAAVKQYHRMQEDIAASLAKGLLDAPEDFFTVVRMNAGKVVMAIAYGIGINIGERALEIGNKAVAPGNHLCDFLPVLKYAQSWVPLQCEAQEGKKVITAHRMQPYEHVKREAAGTALLSLMRDLMTSPPKNELVPKRRLQWIGSAMFGAGSEMTYATVLSSIMAMTLFPDKQKFAQAEIDAVIGTGRLPTIEDRDSLPYVDAVVKETMRWQPAVHMDKHTSPCAGWLNNLKVQAFRGVLPKMTSTMAIISPKIFSWFRMFVACEPNAKYDPEDFIPERFLDPTENIANPATWAFGFGSRYGPPCPIIHISRTGLSFGTCNIYPGRYLAENSIFLFIATILTVFTMSPPK
ncbi:cytochrome P450 [Obba rivulosa]|uniref:Cytochrome P450 n=1 Tax=Obba rivulosa TaxID=1052685 RepID=A0A8E2DLI9_9APHY|nr:cytochrome P450 [Obba rivulosa]